MLKRVALTLGVGLLTSSVAVLAAAVQPATVGCTLVRLSDDALEIRVTVGAGKAAREQSFRLATGARVTLNSQPAKLTDLKPGTRLSITYDRVTREANSVRGTTPVQPRTPVDDSVMPASPDLRPKPATKRPTSKAAGRPQSAADWPQFRGPNRDGHSPDTGLLTEWPSDGPPLLWRATGLGQGFSSVSVAAGRIYTMGNRANEECVIALDAVDGSSIWSQPIGPVRANGGGYGGPRCIPTISDGFLYALGLNGDLVCLDIERGALRWRKDFTRDFGGRMMSNWGFTESPLVDGNQVICTPGGDRATMVALNKATGAVVWAATVPNTGGAAYSSPVIAEVGGIRQYLTLVGRGLIGVSARDGRHLWSYARVANGTANIPTPVVRGDVVFCSTGYQAGAALLRLVPANNGVRAEERYFLSSQQFQNHHGGFVLVGNHIYAGHGHGQGFPVCIDLNSGRAAWGPVRGLGSGSAAVTFADGHLYFRWENGTMALIEATPTDMKVKGSFQLPRGSAPSWPHPVVIGGCLYLRDQEQLYCYDVRA